MGMYTELHMNCQLRTDCPQSVLDALTMMLSDDLKPKCAPPFNGERWWMMLRCDSYYFDADTHSTLRFDDIAKQYYLCIRCNLKNYDYEIEKFVEWITPYIDAQDGDFLGFMRYETDEWPTLLHHPNKWTATQCPT